MKLEVGDIVILTADGYHIYSEGKLNSIGPLIVVENNDMVCACQLNDFLRRPRKHGSYDLGQFEYRKINQNRFFAALL